MGQAISDRAQHGKNAQGDENAQRDNDDFQLPDPAWIGTRDHAVRSIATIAQLIVRHGLATHERT